MPLRLPNLSGQVFSNRLRSPSPRDVHHALTSPALFPTGIAAPVSYGGGASGRGPPHDCAGVPSRTPTAVRSRRLTERSAASKAASRTFSLTEFAAVNCCNLMALAGLVVAYRSSGLPDRTDTVPSGATCHP